MQHSYTKGQLDQYLAQRLQKISDKWWYTNSANLFWKQTEGHLSEEIIREFNYYINDYYMPRSAVKVIDFVNTFLTQYPEFENYARFNPRPKIDSEEDPDPVDIEDVTGLIRHIEQDTLDPRVDKQDLLDTILWLGLTGMRPGNAENLTAKQVRTGLQSKPQCINVDPAQLKIRKRTYVPIHPQLVPILERMTESKADGEPVFNMRPLRRYLAEDVLPLKYRPERAVKIHHLRKFFQQHSAILEMPDVWTNYIMNHQGGRNPIADKHYHNFQSAVYDKYIKYWGSINLLDNNEDTDTEEKPLSESERLEKKIAEKRKMLDAIRAEPEENIEADNDRYDRYVEEERIKDAETAWLVYESIRLDEEIENAKSEKGIHV